MCIKSQDQQSTIAKTTVNFNFNPIRPEETRLQSSNPVTQNAEEGMKTSGYRVLPLLRRGSEVRQSAGLIPRHVRLAVKFREIPRIGSEIPN